MCITLDRFDTATHEKVDTNCRRNRNKGEDSGTQIVWKRHVRPIIVAVTKLREHWDEMNSKMMQRKTELDAMLGDSQRYEAKRNEVEVWLARMETRLEKMRAVGHTADVLEAQLREQKVRWHFSPFLNRAALTRARTTDLSGSFSLSPLYLSRVNGRATDRRQPVLPFDRSNLRWLRLGDWMNDHPGIPCYWQR